LPDVRSGAMSLVQIVKRSASVERLERGEKPVYEFDLKENEQIVGVFYEWETDRASRSTVDHHISVYVAVRL
jgi:hypothetical protein